MRKQVSYLCHKIDDLNNTSLYKNYQKEYQLLQDNIEYLNLLSEIKNIDRENQKDQYFHLKHQIYNYEKQFRIHEKDLNQYLNHLIKRYNELIYQSDLDQRKGNKK